MKQALQRVIRQKSPSKSVISFRPQIVGDKEQGSLVAWKREGTELNIRKKLLQMFVPKNYPRSVREGYLKYCTYSFFNSVSGTVTSTISMQLLLQGLGASPPVATALSATTNWLIKDGIGQLGGVLYSSLVSTKFDSEPRKYRFLSNLLVQGSCILDVCTMWYPHLFLFLASTSNVLKNIGWLSWGASRAAINLGYAKNDNIGDITAKSGAQNTLAGLAGTGIGVGISVLAGVDPTNLAIAFFPMYVINIHMAYMASEWVTTRTLNMQRFERILQPFIERTMEPNTTASQSELASLNNSIQTPESVSDSEVYIKKYKSVFRIPLIVDSPLDKSNLSLSQKEWTCFMESKDPYRLIYRNGKVYLWFLEKATTDDCIRGVYHACIARYLLEKRDLEEGINTWNEINSQSKHVLDSSYGALRSGMLASGWELDNVFFGDDDRRILIT